MMGQMGEVRDMSTVVESSKGEGRMASVRLYEVPRMDLVRLSGADVVCASVQQPDNDVDMGPLLGPTGK